jgi:hypothetical protein
MKAKDLIQGQSLPEAEGQPPRRVGPPRMPSQQPASFKMRGEPGEEEMMPGSERHSMRPRGPFSPQETSMIKDLLLLMATEAMGNDFDGKIARKLMKGEVPTPGELQHIVDEVRRIPDLPEPHQKLMQKLIGHINSASAAEAGPDAPA